MRVLAAGMIALVTFVSSLRGQEASGEWAGEISLANDGQLLQLHVQSTNGAIKGTMDIPLQGTTGIESEMKPSGQRHSARYFWQAFSVATIDWNARKVFGNAGRGIPIYY
jgi:hypothetical protein